MLAHSVAPADARPACRHCRDLPTQAAFREPRLLPARAVPPSGLRYPRARPICPRMTRIPAWIDDRLAPVDKLHVHLAGLRHKAVSVFVRRGAEILLQRRALTKYHTPGLWANSCCTHPHWDEAPLACARRRLGEELGITGLDPVFRERLEYRADVGGGMVEHELVDVFVADAGPGLQPMPDPAEVMDTRWVALPQLQDEIAAEPERFTPWLRIYLERHLEGILG